jgi:hypothetical protein
MCTGLPTPSVASNHCVCKPYTIDSVIDPLLEPWSRELIQRAKIWKGDICVDLATSGVIACRIAGTGANVVAVGASDEAKQRAVDESVAVRWVATSAGLKSAAYSLVTCQVVSDRALFAEARRLLGSGGRALFQSPFGEPFGGFGETEMKQLLNAAKFMAVQVETVNRTVGERMTTAVIGIGRVSAR